MSDSNELLPCPFCGGKAQSERSTERFEYGTGGPYSVMEWGYYVYCEACSAGTHAVDVPPPSEEEAVAAWNRRATPAPVPQPLEMPEDVRETIGEALAMMRHVNVRKYPDEMPYQVESIDAALAWLEQQRPGEGVGG